VAAIAEDEDSVEVVEEALGIQDKADTEDTPKEAVQAKLGTIQAVSLLILHMVPMIRALGATHASEGIRIRGLKQNTLTLIPTGATNSMSSIVRGFATRTSIAGCVLDPRT
jgi:hypothetical protein